MLFKSFSDAKKPYKPTAASDATKPVYASDKEPAPTTKPMPKSK